MPNGKPGDHPITDITIHKIRVYSAEIDRLIEEIVTLGGRRHLDVLVDWFTPPPLPELRKKLEALKRRLVGIDQP
ncbi:MAG TPA: hypothetical protein VI643_02250 [Planctomycetota bacterium]|nr:hypothetical protein [Planctomycetota bacterium]